jgi:hypothetical protein
MQKNSKEHLSYRIFKEVYEYKEKLIPGGLIFYRVEDECLYIGEVISDGQSPYFLYTLWKNIVELSETTQKKYLICKVNTLKLPRYYAILINKMGAIPLKKSGNVEYLRIDI